MPDPAANLLAAAARAREFAVAPFSNFQVGAAQILPAIAAKDGFRG